MSELIKRAAFWGIYWPSFVAATFGFSLRVTGRQNVPAAGPCLLVANHASFLDPWLVGQSAPRRLKYLARDSLFRVPVLAPMIRVLGAVPIDRGFGKEGLQSVLKMLTAGHAVLVFAEGERSPDGQLQPLKPGVALLLKKANCPVVPVGIRGTFAAWPKHRALPNPEPLFLPAAGRSISIAFGQPLPTDALTGSRDGILERIHLEIAASLRVATAQQR